MSKKPAYKNAIIAITVTILVIIIFILINILYFTQIRYFNPNSTGMGYTIRSIIINRPINIGYNSVFIPVVKLISPRISKSMIRTFPVKPFLLRGKGHDGLYIYQATGRVGDVREFIKNDNLYYYFNLTLDNGRKLDFQIEREGLSIYHHPPDRSVPDKNPKVDDAFTIKDGDDLMVRYKGTLESNGYNEPNEPFTEILEMYDYHKEYQ